MSTTAAKYELRLYIAGATHHSMLAVKNIKAICSAYLKDNYSLKIIDIYQQPQLARDEDIIAAPTLIKVQPAPTMRLIGDLSNLPKVLIALGVSVSGDDNEFVGDQPEV